MKEATLYELFEAKNGAWVSTGILGTMAQLNQVQIDSLKKTGVRGMKHFCVKPCQ